MKTAKIEATIEYSDNLPWDDVSIKCFIERLCQYTAYPVTQVRVRVTKVDDREV